VVYAQEGAVTVMFLVILVIPAGVAKGVEVVIPAIWLILAAVATVCVLYNTILS
jgi:hypothetical protein